MSVKVTGFARFSLLEKLDTIMHSNEGSLMKRYLKAVDGLSKEEKEEWQRIRHRVMRVCEAAAAKKIGVSIDAEETWIQDPVDALTILMMDSFNKESAIVLTHYSTIAMTV